MAKPTDVRIVAIRHEFQEYRYRFPIKFGGVPTDSAVLLNVWVRVRTRAGREAEGFGSMPLGNAWAFPPKYVPLDQSLEAMRRLAGRLVRRAADCDQTAHPMDLSAALEPTFFAEAAQLSREMNLAVPIPPLATLVVASPIDAALYDAFGKANGVNIYNALDAQWMEHDLAYYLDDRFADRYPAEFVRRHPLERVPLYHLVGALDPLTAADVIEPVGDGLPETLEEWIERDGLTHLKVKLNGNDLDWDVERMLAVERVTRGVQQRRGVSEWVYSADFNEQCPNVDYLLEWLARIGEGEPGALERLAYIEQPTDRNLKAHPENRMHQAAQIRPVVIDESLVDYESLLTARELGYTGVALKACKGQSHSLWMGAAANVFGMFLAVQDLTCPGASFLQSVGLAARVRGVTAVEGNARQYVPAANVGWAERYPEIFTVVDGTIQTGGLTRPGLGH